MPWISPSTWSIGRGCHVPNGQWPGNLRASSRDEGARYQTAPKISSRRSYAAVAAATATPTARLVFWFSGASEYAWPLTLCRKMEWAVEAIPETRNAQNIALRRRGSMLLPGVGGHLSTRTAMTKAANGSAGMRLNCGMDGMLAWLGCWVGRPRMSRRASVGGTEDGGERWEKWVGCFSVGSAHLLRIAKSPVWGRGSEKTRTYVYPIARSPISAGRWLEEAAGCFRLYPAPGHRTRRCTHQSWLAVSKTIDAICHAVEDVAAGISRDVAGGPRTAGWTNGSERPHLQFCYQGHRCRAAHHPGAQVSRGSMRTLEFLGS